MAGTYQTTNPQAIVHPLRSIPLVRPACQVLGWSDDQKAVFALQVAKNNLDAAEKNFAAACAGLGKANKIRGKMAATKRHWLAVAFRNINMRRAGLRQARAALAVALAAMPAGIAN